MIDLKCYIKESLLDNEDEILDDISISIKNLIKDFLRENYRDLKDCEISDKPNKDGKYIIDCNSNLMVTKRGISALTNEYFIFGKVKKDFYCNGCHYLTSLEGAPKIVGGDFGCNNCSSLTSLEGAPKEVGRDFECYNCSSLTSLEGAPEKIGGDFYCPYCDSLTSLKGAPKNVEGSFNCIGCRSLSSLEGAPEEVNDFNCNGCSKLTSLEGAPKYVGKDFCCARCGGEFTEEDVKKVSNVKKRIYT